MGFFCGQILVRCVVEVLLQYELCVRFLHEVVKLLVICG